MRAYPIAVAAFLLWAGRGGRSVGGPEHDDHPGTGQDLGVVVTAPPNNTQVPIPPGTQQVEANSRSAASREPIKLLYVVDVSGAPIAPTGAEPRTGGRQRRRYDHGGGRLKRRGEAGETLDGEVSASWL